LCDQVHVRVLLGRQAAPFTGPKPFGSRLDNHSARSVRKRTSASRVSSVTCHSRGRAATTAVASGTPNPPNRLRVVAVSAPLQYGPKAGNVQEVFQLFDLELLWKDRRPFVDYILGAEPGGGVFAIGFCDNDYQRQMLDYYKMGRGPFYLFYRPYHLCHIEAMSSVADAVLHGKALIQPEAGFRTNVYAYAKRDLDRGERLDGIGGYACYGLIENCAGPEGNSGLPICLADDLALLRDIHKDEKILMSDVEYDQTRKDFELYEKALRASWRHRT